MELERTGRIGKPPESRTGRHRVLNPEVETVSGVLSGSYGRRTDRVRSQALFEHVKDKPELSVDDMLWWLYETYKIVVGTRTIRRVFERKGEAGNRFKKGKQAAELDAADDVQGEMMPIHQSPVPHVDDVYQSPYAPMAEMVPQQHQAELTLAQALTNANYPPAPAEMEMVMAPDDGDDAEDEDEETLQLQLQQVELQKRELELKIKMHRLKQGKNPQNLASAGTVSSTTTAPSTLYKPGAHAGNSPPKRDSRSKKKIEESRRRTAERQERMLRDLERRSRRREHLTAEWVQSKDIWPLRAQGELAELMHRYGYYTFNMNNIDTFEAMYRELYQLVDLSKNDWDPQVHDEMLRERMKRKMGQLRTKMQKTGEIIGRADGYAGWQKADDYTGEQAGHILGGDDSHDPQDDGIDPHHDPAMQVAHASIQGQAGAQQQVAPSAEDQMHYEPVPDPNQMGAPHGQPIYGNPPMMHHQQAPPYPMMDNHHQKCCRMGSCRQDTRTGW
jgi:hypothetical protein